MNTAITITGTTSDVLEQLVRDRLEHALNQHASRVELVDVRFRDLNGPRGGVDTQVKIRVSLNAGPEVLIEETGHDAYAVTSRAADRVKQSVGRELDKQKP